MSNNKLAEQPISKLFPSIVTIIGLCLGLFALKYTLMQKWELAVIFIILAGFVDGMDGRLARMLNASSEFGAQLDSLADFFSFCIAPALMLYLWNTHDVKAFGWAAALFFIICGAIRLARFNCDSGTQEEIANFFTGIPVTMAAPLIILPMMISFFMKDKFPEIDFQIPSIYLIIYIGIIALLMVSRVPTISLKKVKINPKFYSMILAITGLLIVGMILEPWIIFPFIGAIYILSIPITCIQYLKTKKI